MHSGTDIRGRSGWAGPPANLPPLLSREEEAELATRSAAGDGDALARLVASHRQFVVRIAGKYRNYGLPMQDLVQEGLIGFIHAVRKFDRNREARLATYAMWWVRASIQEHVVRSWSLVRLGTTAAQKALFFRLRRMMAELKEGADATSEEVQRALSKRFGMPLKDVVAMVRRAGGHDYSLNRRLVAGEPGEWLERIADPQANPEEIEAAASQRRFWGSLIERALAALPPREATIIRCRYLMERVPTREAIGRELGISKERVRQLEKAAMEKLAALMAPLRQGAEL